MFSSAPSAAGASLRREYYILMEYCSRGTLSQALAARQQSNRPYAEKELLSVFLAVCAAVEHMHSHDIVHRDLKPENVLINDDNELKLCDFGSCTYESKVYSTPAEIGQLEEQVQKYSTATYRAPEQVDIYVRKLVGKPVDVWALGCILFVMCYFELPFPTG
jgi:serine/threonine protein kinase